MTRRSTLRLALMVTGLCACLAAPNAQHSGPWTRHTIDSSSLGADGVRAVDANGDGDLDIVSSAEGSSRRIQVHWAPPAGAYTRESDWRTETLYSDGSQ